MSRQIVGDALIQAITDDKINTVRALLDDYPSLVNYQCSCRVCGGPSNNEYGYYTVAALTVPPLYYALAKKNKSIVELLLSHGADPRLKGYYPQAPEYPYYSKEVPICLRAYAATQLPDVVMDLHRVSLELDQKLTLRNLEELRLKNCEKLTATSESFVARFNQYAEELLEKEKRRVEILTTLTGNANTPMTAETHATASNAAALLSELRQHHREIQSQETSDKRTAKLAVITAAINLLEAILVQPQLVVASEALQNRANLILELEIACKKPLWDEAAIRSKTKNLIDRVKKIEFMIGFAPEQPHADPFSRVRSLFGANGSSASQQPVTGTVVGGAAAAKAL